MKILFVADARSPIARNWIRHFVERGDEVFLASTFDCGLDFPVARFLFIPTAFSQLKARTSQPGGAPAPMPASARTLALRARLRQWMGPLTLPSSARKLRAFIREVKPDLLHAMRIPYEGMLAAAALEGLALRPPFLVSVWGNDFTLHAPSAPLMRYFTRRTMKAAGALHTDCRRDARLAQEWGFDADKPVLVVPGGGGIKTEIFYPPKQPPKEPVVIQPRGFRAYVNNEAFFKSIPLILEKRGDARFVCPAMRGEPQAAAWIKELGVEHAVQLKPPCSQAQMGEEFRAAQALVSPTTHDGTPNSLLEGMACGCFPIAGDLESIREWVERGKNGLLVNPNDPLAIAEAVLTALEREDLRREAAAYNAEVIAARGGYERNMNLAVEFYKKAQAPKEKK